MWKMIGFIAAALFLSGPGFAQGPEVGEGQRAIDLMWDCQGRGTIYDPAVKNDFPDADFFGTFDRLTCAAYVSGIVDMNALSTGIFGKPFFCFPKRGIPQEQQILIFLKWAEKYPERLHESRRISLVTAMQEAFPCSDN